MQIIGEFQLNSENKKQKTKLKIESIQIYVFFQIVLEYNPIYLRNKI